MNRNIRKCPYCNSRVSYFGALSELNSGEHTCPVCNKNSNISYSKMIYVPTAILLAVALIVAGLLFWFKIITNLFLALILILVPFAAFYFLTPLYFRLELIKSEAQTPVMRVESKRDARIKKQSQVLKNDEKIKTENEKKEKKSSEKKNTSGESKFLKFVRTYIIVPDDEDEQQQASQQKNNDENFEQKNNEHIEEKFEPNPEENTVTQNKTENTDIKKDYKTRFNFNGILQKFDINQNKKTDSVISDDITADEKSDIKPVYHKFTKTDKVNFIYFPDKKSQITVDLNKSENNADDSKPKLAETIQVTKPVEEEKETEAIELVVGKAIEAERNEEENQEIMMFFNSKPSEAEEDEFGENTIEEENNNTQPEPVREQAESENDGWFDYKSETGDFITLIFEEPKKEPEPQYIEVENFKYLSPQNNSDLTNSIIELSDVSFDIPEIDDISDIDANFDDSETGSEELTESEETVNSENDFIEYEIEDNLPIIEIKNEKKAVSENNDADEEDSFTEINFDDLEVNTVDLQNAVTEESENIDVIEEETSLNSFLDDATDESIPVNDSEMGSEPVVSDLGIDYLSVNNVVTEIDSAKLESVSISEENEEISDEDLEIFKSDEFMYDELSNSEYVMDDEPIDILDNENDYYKFNENEDEEEFSDETIEIQEDEEDYYKFDEEDDDEDYLNEAVEGAIEYVPKEDFVSEDEDYDSYVVDYSDEKEIDETFDFSEPKTKYYKKTSENVEADTAIISKENALPKKVNTSKNNSKLKKQKKTDNLAEGNNDKLVNPAKTDSNENEIKHLSKYEKKFPNAAKAAAAQAAELELKKQKAKEEAKKKNPTVEAESKTVKKTVKNTKNTKKLQDSNQGFFSELKNKIIEATEEERQSVFEEEERERKLAEKEARRRAKEKEKEKAEKLKVREEREKVKNAAGVSTAKDSYKKLEKQSNKKPSDSEQRSQKSQKTQRIEKSRVKAPSNIPADGKTRVFKAVGNLGVNEYEQQEKIVLESIKDKVQEFESKKISEEEKVKIISEKVDEEKRQEKIEKLKNEQEQQRVKKEKERKEKQIQSKRLEKAEEIRKQQVRKAQKNQSERKKPEERRDTNNVSLKEVDNVRSKVSQKKKKRKQQIDEYFNN